MFIIFKKPVNKKPDASASKNEETFEILPIWNKKPSL